MQKASSEPWDVTSLLPILELGELIVVRVWDKWCLVIVSPVLLGFWGVGTGHCLQSHFSFSYLLKDVKNTVFRVQFLKVLTCVFI